MTRAAVIGVGLIGGSIGLAARERLGARVRGFDAAPGVLDEALERGAIDEAAATLEEAVADAELAFVAVPVGALPDALARVLAAAPGDCVVSDVGSTKRAIVASQADERFVGGHPLAGAETAGVAHARGDLFENATWYLTPARTTSGVLYERLHRAICAFGAQPAAIAPDDHDAILALVSHLPHVLANLLVEQAAGALGADGERLPATGPSFRDATRVAGANSAIWTDIYLSNREALAAQLDALSARIADFRAMLEREDAPAIEGWNDAAAADRRRLLDAQMAGGELHELRVAVPNRPGIVAELALELGQAGVNIADMALYPAADMSEGVVALWIAGADTSARAQEILDRLGFRVAPA